MKGIFSYDNVIMSALLKVVDALILGVLWLVCCVPVVTAGAASTAFYYAYNKSVRQEQGYALREFFSAFKSNFKQATKIWLIVLGLNTVVLADCYLLFVYMERLPVASALMGIMLVLFVALTMWGCLLFPYIARFEAGTKDTMRNAAIMTVANIFWGILLAILFAAAVIVSFWVPVAGVFAPAVYMFFANRILEHVFAKYIKPEEEETDI